MQPASYLDSELHITSSRSAHFSYPGGDYTGDVELDAAVRCRLRELERQPALYGDGLFAALFPEGSRLREGFRAALAGAHHANQRLRFRLHIAPDVENDVHRVFWELLHDTDEHMAIGRSPDTAFSRYNSVARSVGIAVPGRPRLLWLVSAPIDAPRYGMAEIDRNESSARLERHFAALREDMDVDVLEGPADPNRLRDRLISGGYHALHVFGHGLIRQDGQSHLVLENEAGQAEFVNESLLSEIFLGIRSLRLVSLIACHGGAHSSGDNFSGLAGRLVERGIPAVIAMRRAVTVKMGLLFSKYLYRELARTGQVDIAVNEARQQLYLEKSNGLAWSSPMLFMRLPDGKLWNVVSLEAADDEQGDRKVSAGQSPGHEEMPLYLRVLDSPYVYEGPPGAEVITLGRQRRKGKDPESGNDIVVRVPKSDRASLRISRRHLEIHRAHGSFFVVDKSGGRTALNGRPLAADRPTAIRSGDRIDLAGVLTLEVLIRPPCTADDRGGGRVDGPLQTDSGVVMEATLGDMVTEVSDD